MRMIILGLVALVIIGGGAGAYFYFANPAEAAVDEKDVDEQKKEDDAKSDIGNIEFVKLDPLILPVIDNDGVQQIVSLVVAIEVDGVYNADKVRAMSPRLKDAYIQDMYGVLNKHAALKGGVIQVGVIKNRLNKITQKVMGEGIANDVLLQVVQQRPI